jgi:hypothetical protein
MSAAAGTRTPLAKLLQELVDQGLSQPTKMPDQFTYPSVLVSVPSVGANSAGDTTSVRGAPDGRLVHDSLGDQR